MIKSSVNTGASAATKVEFPALYRNKTSGAIVFFSAPTEGTIVVPARSNPYLTAIGCYGALGDHNKYWVSAHVKDHWEPLKSGNSVTLTVE